MPTLFATIKVGMTLCYVIRYSYKSIFKVRVCKYTSNRMTKIPTDLTPPRKKVFLGFPSAMTLMNDIAIFDSNPYFMSPIRQLSFN